jgi:hypothetical protein
VAPQHSSLMCVCLQGCRAISPIWMSYYVDVSHDQKLQSAVQSLCQGLPVA